jgi:CheY-like chemotaxis protein
VLICDDRPAVRQELSEALRSDSLDSIHEVSDGAALPIVIGSLADIDLLAAAYARGAGGLVLWEPRSAGPEPG